MNAPTPLLDQLHVDPHAPQRARVLETPACHRGCQLRSYERVIDGRLHIFGGGAWRPVPSGGTTVSEVFGTETALTWAGAIGSSTTAGRQSNAIDNTSALAVDGLLAISIVFPNSAPANDKSIYIYAGAYIGATNGWQGRPALTGSDGAYTFNDITTTPSGLFLCQADYQVQNTTGLWVVPSLAAVFGGLLPPKMAFAVANYSGQTITTFSATYRLANYTNA